MREGLKVGISGVRGVIGDSFTPQLAAAFAQAFGTFVGRGSVVVGRDTRPSGLMVERAVTAGLQSVGCKPVLLGVVPSPTVLMATPALGARGGVAITASHNPVQWNALKFLEPTGLFLSAVRVEELQDIYHQQDFPLVEEASIPGTDRYDAAMDDHIGKILDYVDQASIKARGFKVAIDCCNGVGALHSAPFLRNCLGCEVIPLFDTPSGVFEREPEPLPHNLSRLRETVTAENCDIGFAQDPDGDRLAIVNECGEAIGEDITLAFVVQQVLEHHSRGRVVITSSASKCIEDIATGLGNEVIRCKIGEFHVAEKILTTGAVVGGEGNGGVIVPAIHACRDSYVGMAVVLELMAMAGKKVSELREAIPHYHLVKDKVPIRPEQAAAVLRRLRRDYAEHRPNIEDGVFVDFGDGWVHARRSNTEPVIRITAEAPTQDRAAGLAGGMRECIVKQLSAE